MKRKSVTTIIIISSFIIIFIMIHSTPNTALRTHLFMTGHPIISFNTKIVDDKLHNRLNEQALVPDKNISFYIITMPLVEEETQSELSNYKVTKIGFMFFAKYSGEA